MQWADTLFINPGMIALDTMGQAVFPYLAFNATAQFDQHNYFSRVEPGTSLQLTIMNLDSIAHNILIDEGMFSTGVLLPGQTSTIDFGVLPNGIYGVRDSLELNRFLGLSTFFVVWPESKECFYWHLNEHQSDWNADIRNGVTIDTEEYTPDYFSINDRVHPQIMSDTLASVTGKVNDSILIFVQNSGRMAHSIHFHGYHVEVLYSNGNALDIGREKDTIPVKPGKGQVYLLVPFQPGIFPVHDHNLISTTGGGNFPSGMMVMMNIGL
ncbi:MAG TPA: hypothetical protein DDX92_04890 [Flavobacteriales bacterium]|nr:hypothetical protein [Flavobacteriales bacterium]